MIGGSDVKSSKELMEILRKWKSTDGTLVVKMRRKRTRVSVDTLCPLEIDSFLTKTCVD